MLEVLTNTFGNRSPLVQSIKTLSCSMFCRILSLRYLWQSCKQFYVAVCLHQLIKRILITSMPHLEHNPSLLHQDPPQLLSNLPTQASSFSPTTHWSAALSPNKLFLIICGCWGFSLNKEVMHAACLEIVVWVLRGEQGGFQERPLTCRGAGIWRWSVFITSKERRLSFSQGGFLSLSTLFFPHSNHPFQSYWSFSVGKEVSGNDLMCQVR